MKKLIFALLTTYFLLVATASTAADVTLFGSPDCGAWVKTPSYADKAWLMGYLSGLNSGLAGRSDRKISIKRDPLSKLNSPDQAFLWMDNYCKNNPLKLIAMGAYELYLFELNK